MPVTPPPPLLKRVPPGAWTAFAWCAGTVFTYLTRVRLPGEYEPDHLPAVQLYRWDGLLFLVVATTLTFVAAALLARRPLTAVGLLLTASVIETITLAVSGIPLAQFLAVQTAVYFIAAADRPRRTGAVAVGLSLALLVVYMAIRISSGWMVGTSAELAVALVTLIAWLLGDAAHRSRAHAEQLATRAAGQAVTAERLRIAREMHDTVAHSIGIIALQAGAAARVVATRPEAAREAMSAVEHEGRETLAGLRRMLVALRHADSGEGQQASVAAGLADVERLAAVTSAAGVRVDLRWEGERRELPPDVDLSAFRIVQESVTNVVRHAGAQSCRVTLDYRADDALAIDVTDDGRGRGSATDTGFGLAGMRERVALLKGEFEAGPRPEGGFRVAARLPIPLTVALQAAGR
ncbi:sensor histidine kinase [Streptomyces turgidiscabies]|uniref:histidine kinase n=1 Tax=Streptomyces turgidiscabies (strain Car8) TaxID=698760 RepID=L7F8Q2_STRT8|nr:MULTISPECIES: sensor histidine kinase [Streptomyces]ELP67582.1 histidine kinase [Streptomyces turgidiscabies Car8]MDX3497091.1 sensor histidine kinase [Streptomyces turgidiscabies]GAQ68761.1 sensor histidine kinase DesK [Streptomyces turgidiscabies]